ncbi:class I SAM-dependent methyltransferase [Pseudidiomarina aestuarii]|uniref:Class I SAM-dependent methyltransferase n=1 Tax=Pseudidiomarina aestuarii TaxID=624146 RepID=A0A2T4CV07_9GAMM|nr:class I SAM-dependent methyltransferase [Pseudidiomarina aestuarii]PTB88460.1 class I SAM-dependent methyltransferase [Pseudidiomarina aestuarii]PTB88711.1 class I SAM-dependent methyltransferase [Pseudidiomarina aestuarii]
MDSIHFYADNAAKLAEQYDSLSFEQVHGDWLRWLPKHGSALDIGAGSGRDALALTQLGLKVTAIEPVQELRSIGQSKSADVGWLDDTLPELKQVTTAFDLILVSAVWMHLTPEQQRQSLDRIAKLLNPNGIWVVTLRHGGFDDGRQSYPQHENELFEWAQDNGLELLQSAFNHDQLARQQVRWQTLVFRLKPCDDEVIHER